MVPISGMPPLPIALNADLSAKVPMPPVPLLLLPMARDPALMGTRIDGHGANVFVWSITAPVTTAGAGAAIIAFLVATGVV